MPTGDTKHGHELSLSIWSHLRVMRQSSWKVYQNEQGKNDQDAMLQDLLAMKPTTVGTTDFPPPPDTQVSCTMNRMPSTTYTWPTHRRCGFTHYPPRQVEVLNTHAIPTCESSSSPAQNLVHGSTPGCIHQTKNLQVAFKTYRPTRPKRALNLGPGPAFAYWPWPWEWIVDQEQVQVGACRVSWCSIH